MKTNNVFDFEKIRDFDNHIRLSIPSYDVLTKIFSGIAEYYAYSGSSVVDIGCSTGNFISSLNKKTGCKYIGIDNIDFTESDDFDFIKGDCFDVLSEIEKPSLIVSMFFLQFLGKAERNKIVSKIKEKVNEGALFLVAEKIEIDNCRLQTLIHRMHVKEKRKGFTDTEILDKDEQLANSMYCLTESELKKELSSIGTMTRVWQSYNFVGYVVEVTR